MDIVKLTNEVTQKVVDEKLESIVEVQITKTIESIISDSFREYSDFGKLVKSKVESSLNVSLNELKLPDMSGFITDKVRQIAVNSMKESAMEDLQKSINAIIGSLPSEIKLSDIVKSFGEHCHENVSSWWEEDYKSIAFYCVKDDAHGWWKVKMDEDADCPEYKCAYSFYVNETGSMFILKTKEKLSKFEQSITRSDFEMLLLRLYHAHGTKIIIDPEQVDVDFNFEEEY